MNQQTAGGPQAAPPRPDAPPSPPHAGEPRPWRQHKPVIASPPEHEWGFLDDGQLVAADRAEMERLVTSGYFFSMAWTPDSPHLVWPEELPWIFPAIRARMRRDAWLAARPFVVLTALCVALLGWAKMAMVLGLFPKWPFYLAILGAWTALKVQEVRRVARLTPPTLRAELDEARHGSWLNARAAPGTDLLRNAVFGVAMAQVAARMTGHDDVAAAALVKDAVLRGEVWRLLTAGYLHVEFVHFVLNLVALLWLGRLVEAHANRASLFLVFLLTVLTGNLASLYLTPQQTSLGSSTGLMGLIGFMVVVSWRRRERVPASLLRTLVTNIAIIACVGVAGARVVDNGGHLGGLVGGLLLGLALVPRVRGEDGVGWAPSPALRAAGRAAAGVLVAGAAATAARLFLGPY